MQREKRASNRQATESVTSAPDRDHKPEIKMKATAYIAALTMGFMLFSCANMNSINSTAPRTLGTVREDIPGTVVAARTVQVEATDADRNFATGMGAVIGAGSGALLGRGKGQLVSSMGFGVLGAGVGRLIGNELGKIPAQELTIRPDGSKSTLTVTQPIFAELGAIPVGTHGTLQRGATGSKFLPDGI